MRTVFVLALLFTGCVMELEDEQNDDEIGTSSRVALNGLGSTNFTQLRAVAQGSLATAGTRVPALFTTADGRELFAYVASCAMTAGKTVSVTSGGASYTFTGVMGIAKEWEVSTLPTSKYKRVSACILARTNYFGTEVSISMRNANISTKTSELNAYTVVEGAFWGDLFSTTVTMRACASPAKLAGSTVSTMPLRECAAPADATTTKCKFGFAGECSKVCVTNLTTKIGYSNCEGNVDSIVVYLAKP